MRSLSRSTCYQSKLTKHLGVCNVKRRLDAQPAFIVKGINLDEEAMVAPSRVPLSQLDESVLETVIRKIHSAYGKFEMRMTTCSMMQCFIFSILLLIIQISCQNFLKRYCSTMC